MKRTPTTSEIYGRIDRESLRAGIEKFGMRPSFTWRDRGESASDPSTTASKPVENTQESQTLVPDEQDSHDPLVDAFSTPIIDRGEDNPKRVREVGPKPSPHQEELVGSINSITPKEIRAYGNSILVEYYKALTAVVKFKSRSFSQADLYEANKLKLILGQVTAELQNRLVHGAEQDRREIVVDDLEVRDYATVILDRLQVLSEQCNALIDVMHKANPEIGINADDLTALGTYLKQMREQFNMFESMKKRKPLAVGNYKQAIEDHHKNYERFDSAYHRFISISAHIT